MQTYILKRLLMIPVTLFGVVLVTFFVMRLAPGDPAAMIVGTGISGEIKQGQLNREAIEQWRKERHLDEPTHMQFAYWLGDVIRFDFGRSFIPPRRPVMEEILERLPITIVMNVIAFFLIYLIAIPVGIYSAVAQYSIGDRIVTVLLFILYSLPSFWVATMCLVYLCSGEYLQWFPTQGYTKVTVEEAGLWGYVTTWARHLFLPVMCLTYGGFAMLSRQMRVGMLENIRLDYVRTARAKGLPERRVILKHVLRNSLIPVITLFGLLFPAMLAGSVIIEYIFGIPGMGRLFFEAILTRNYPLVMAEVVLSAMLTLIGVLISDLLYAIVNPTITLK